MKIGFTGTQVGMSTPQKRELEFLLRFNPVEEFHHGDCIGADEEAHRAVRYIAPYARVLTHPCTIARKRAFCAADFVYDAKPPLDRNHDIVDACDFLIVAPKDNEEELRSGTWATYRYAKKIGKPLKVLQR